MLSRVVSLFYIKDSQITEMKTENFKKTCIFLKRLLPLAKILTSLFFSRPKTILPVMGGFGFHFGKRTSILYTCIFALMFSIETTFGVVEAASCFFEGFLTLGPCVDDFESFAFWFDFYAFLTGVSHADFFVGDFSSASFSSSSAASFTFSCSTWLPSPGGQTAFQTL